MRCLGWCDLPWILVVALIGLYLLLWQRNPWGLLILVVLVVGILLWLVLWRRSCRLQPPRT